jgi:hypothetical protein
MPSDDFKDLVQQSKHVPVPIRQHIQHVIQVVRTTYLTDEEIRGLYSAVTSRMVNKTCSSCGKLKLGIEGSYTYIDGDMSKPKRFVCKECK